jgi:peptide/nickel transport system substrate-binding protein
MGQAVEDFLDPMGNRQHSPLPERMAKQWDMPLAEWRDIPLGLNTEEAKLLFEEAGLEKEMEILVPKDPKRIEIGRRLATGIRKAGYRASVSPAAWKSFLEKRVSGVPSDYTVFIDGAHGGPDPDFFTYQPFHRDQEGKNQRRVLRQQRSHELTRTGSTDHRSQAATEPVRVRAHDDPSRVGRPAGVLLSKQLRDQEQRSELPHPPERTAQPAGREPRSDAADQ